MVDSLDIGCSLVTSVDAVATPDISKTEDFNSGLNSDPVLNSVAAVEVESLEVVTVETVSASVVVSHIYSSFIFV